MSAGYRKKVRVTPETLDQLFDSNRKARDWVDDAKCRGMPTEKFYSEAEWKLTHEPECLSICRECPVRVRCLEYALETEEPWGVWGGLTPAERSKILKQRRLDRAFLENEKRNSKSLSESPSTESQSNRSKPPERSSKLQDLESRLRHRAATETSDIILRSWGGTFVGR